MPMPGLKSLKAIGRRKSATPGLDDTSPTTSSSSSGFRVIPREEVVRKSVASFVDKPIPAVLDHRRAYFEEDSSSSNRGSGSSATTVNSRFYDSYSPVDSTRLPPIPHATSRNRNQNKPPRTYLDLPNDLEHEDFGSLFSSVGERHSQVMDENMLAVPPPPILRSDSEPILSSDNSWQYKPAKTPPPMAFRRHADLQPSPPSANSKTSRDGLLSSPPSTTSPYRDETPPPPPISRSPLSKLTDSLDEIQIANNHRIDMPDVNSLRRSESIESFSRSGVDEDTDAQMVRNSFMAMRRGTGRSVDANGSPQRGQKSALSQSLQVPLESSATSSDASGKTPSISSDDSSTGPEKRGVGETTKSDKSNSTNTTPRQSAVKPVVDDDDDEPLGSLAAKAVKKVSYLPQAPPRSPETATRPKSRGSQDSPPSKRMSTIQELGPIPTSHSSKTQGEEVKERRPSPTKQTRKEAQEILNRQKISRDIGDQTSAIPRRPLPPHLSQSAPNLLSVKGLPPASESSSDDDDEIPLAVLQAHNFPNRMKTPDPRLSQQSYIGTSSRAPSVFGAASVMNNRTSLPPFARKLPEDPHMSTPNLLAGNASRESLHRPSMYPPPGQSPVPGLPPGGLVGVIAEEEKMKSFRRAGVDNPRTALPHIGNAGGLTPAMSMGMGNLNIPGLGPGMGAPNLQMMQMASMQDQSQINQQLLQVVQQQTVMLQAMYAQMQGIGAGMTPGMDQNGYFPPQSETPGSPRPYSMMPPDGRPDYNRSRSMVNLARPGNAPRTMSMINTTSPFARNWAGPSEPLINGAGSVRGMTFDGGYAHSVAASERSNIGQPSRYRPVTNSHLNDTSSTVMSIAPSVAPTADTDAARKKKSGFFSAIMHPKGKGNEAGAIDEEEEDWSHFAKKRRSGMPSSFR